MIRPFAISLAAALSLLAAPFCGADEPYSVTHNGPITVRVLSGKDGQPIVHSHLILIAGYDQGQIRDQLWREETLTDAQGQARLSKQFANLPWLQVWVDKKPLCQANPRKTSFSVERILRDGLSAPNRCGTITVEDAPGLFTVFVQTGKKGALAKLPVANTPAPVAAPIALVPPPLAVATPAPARTASVPAKATLRIDLPDAPAFFFPASAPVVVSEDRPTHAAMRRPVRRVAAHKARRGSHKARRTPPACEEPKPAAKAPAAKPPAKATAKAPTKNASKPNDTKGKTTAVPAKKIDQKPKPPAAGNKPAANAKPSSPTPAPPKKK
jgi:hypothetical protein